MPCPTRVFYFNTVSAFPPFYVSCRKPFQKYSLRKSVGKVLLILVTLTSRSDSDFERSNVSLKENKPDVVNPNANDIDYYVRKNEGKYHGFRQTE